MAQSRFVGITAIDQHRNPTEPAASRGFAQDSSRSGALAADRTAAPQGAEDAAANAATEAMNATRVLLVDDEDLLLEVLAAQLDDAGYSVLAAANGTEALALLAAGEAVDVLITDLSMPGMDGLAVIRAAQEARPRLPVVLMTGYVDDGVAIAVREAVTGSYSVLCKPFRLHELVDRIQQLLAARENAGTNQLASW
jgi:CheY-like chemotaxis protein